MRSSAQKLVIMSKAQFRSKAWDYGRTVVVWETERSWNFWLKTQGYTNAS
jgi:hypothetical protein